MPDNPKLRGGSDRQRINIEQDYEVQEWSQSLGVSSEQLSDFEPKGAACAAFGVLHEGGFPQRALVAIDSEGVFAGAMWRPRRRSCRRSRSCVKAQQRSPRARPPAERPLSSKHGMIKRRRRRAGGPGRQ